DHFTPPVFFKIVCGIEHEQLFAEFNVSAARNLSLSSEVRMRAEYNILEKMKWKSLAEEKDCLLGTKDKEIKELKSQLLKAKEIKELNQHDQYPHMDRISNLPLSLLETILCLLPYHEVVRTSTLSKEWRYHWTDVTKIVVIEDTRTLNRIKLLSGVSQALLMHKGPIHEVTLSVAKDDHWGFDTAIRRIISHLSSKKAVKKLTVDFGSRGYHNSLPISLFLMSQLTDLKEGLQTWRNLR
ncbi:F-box/FBD/LRR-repeat protein-like protein, partial [Tanacetum coccineum]